MPQWGFPLKRFLQNLKVLIFQAKHCYEIFRIGISIKKGYNITKFGGTKVRGPPQMCPPKVKIFNHSS